MNVNSGLLLHETTYIANLTLLKIFLVITDYRYKHYRYTRLILWQCRTPYFVKYLRNCKINQVGSTKSSLLSKTAVALHKSTAGSIIINTQLECKNKESSQGNLQKLDLRNSMESNESVTNANVGIVLSPYFATPLWKTFYDLEVELNLNLATLNAPESIKYVYNPIEYASELHCAYLQRFLDGPKRLVFVGMNPGPNGMGQTGIPFGNVKTVRNLMNITGRVQQPLNVHPKRQVKGMNCTTEEPSGVRIWSLFERLAGSLDTFSRQCFVHNFCPLAFFDLAGKNITPSEFRGEYKTQLRDACLSTLYKQLDLLRPEVIVAVGNYVFECLKNYKQVTVLKMPHPSPRAVNNTNWPEKAENWLKDNNLLKYIENAAE